MLDLVGGRLRTLAVSARSPGAVPAQLIKDFEEWKKLIGYDAWQ